MGAVAPRPDDIERFVEAARRMGLRADAVEEIESHLHDIVDELIGAGHDPATASSMALDRFGMLDRRSRRALLQPWRPAGYEFALAAVVALCAFGLSGLIAAAVRAAFGGSRFIGAVTEEIVERNSQRMIVGACGVMLAAWMWLRRAGPPVRRTSLPEMVPWLFAGAGLVFCSVGAIDGVVSADEELICLRWASLGVAAAAVSLVYRRIRRVMWPHDIVGT